MSGVDREGVTVYFFGILAIGIFDTGKPMEILPPKSQPGLVNLWPRHTPRWWQRRTLNDVIVVTTRSDVADTDVKVRDCSPVP